MNNEPQKGVCQPINIDFRKRVIQLRQTGMTIDEIRVVLGNEFRGGKPFSHGYIYKQYTKAMKSIIVEDVTTLRKLENARLDALQEQLTKMLTKVHYHIARGGVVRDTVDNENGSPTYDQEGNLITERVVDITPNLAIMDRILKVMERRARLLGLDAPVKTAMTNPDGTEEAKGVLFYIPSNGRDQAETEEVA